MPPLAAMGASIATAATAAASAVTLTGLATGAAIVGTGMQLVGMATGSKTLQKVGMGFNMASGVGFAANGISSMMSNSAKSSSLLSASDDLASNPLKGRAKNSGLASFNPTDTSVSSADDFITNSGKIGSKATKTSFDFDPELEKSFFQRAGNTLTQYNPLMNVLGGVGEAYMMNERMDLERELNDKRVNIDQQRLDMINRNNGTPLNPEQPTGFSRNINAYTGLLGR